MEVEGDDEDEETLKLKLAAIEAKLKLKRLQSKIKNTANSSDTENQPEARPKSVTSSRPTSRLRTGQNRQTSTSGRVEVPASPTRKPPQNKDPKSPSRVLLGIDKGATAGDVSLRPVPNGSDGRHNAYKNGDGRTSRFDSVRRNRSHTPLNSDSSNGVKSFSERMAGIRSEANTRDTYREHLRANRRTGFHLNSEELRNLRAAAEEARSHTPPRSPIKRDTKRDFARDEVLKSYHEDRGTSKGLQRSNTLPSLLRHNSNETHTGASRLRSPSRASKSQESSEQIQAPSSPPSTVSSTTGDTSYYDPYGQVHLSNRILPHSFLQRTLSSVNPVRISYLLKTVKGPDFELPESVAGDFAVFGIIASVSKPYDHKNRRPIARDENGRRDQKWEDGKQNDKKFMVLTLTDLKWTLDLFLFGTAVPRYHRLHPGTVIAILNPGIMPPKPGKEDTGAFSLTLHSGEETVLEIGTSQDLGFCKSICKNGRECGSWLDKRKTEFCDFHVDVQVQRAQAGRMGVNGGSNAFAPGGGRFGSLNSGGGRQGRGKTQGGEHTSSTGVRRGVGLSNGSKRDWETGERFFISQASAPRPSTASSNYSRPGSAAALLDAELDDPFLAEGTVSRESFSKGDRVRKHLANQQQERDIARKLGGMSGTTGAEYLRLRSRSGEERKKETAERSAEVTKAEVLGRGEKRGAEHVRLSPVKKTRFLTDKGIKIAGRESLGIVSGANEEDELDIV